MPPRSPQSRDAKITPLPLQTSAIRKLQRVFVFGGTFDPPHRYHTSSPRLALQWLGAGEPGDGTSILLYVPAAQNPLKATTPDVSDDHRIKMLQIAQSGHVRNSKHARGHEAFGFVWTDEIDRAKHDAALGQQSPSYSIDTIRRLRSMLPKACDVRLLMGIDQVLQLHKWKDARELIKLAPPLLFPRDGVETPLQVAINIHRACEEFWSLQEIGTFAMSVLPVAAQQVSSTFVREQLADKNRAKFLKSGVLDGDVALYIKEHKLYMGASKNSDKNPAKSNDTSASKATKR
jgi:nicotinic acid mononucleotide adenylyltransferase